MSSYHSAGGSARSGPGQPSAGERLQTNTLRGLACLLVVLTHATIEVRLHAEGSVPSVSLFNDYTKFVRIPLFTFLSGYVYACRPLVDGNRWEYLRKKARRLLLPMLFVSLVTILAQALVRSEPAVQPLLVLWAAKIIQPSFHLWFIEALLVIFIGLGLGLYRYVFSKWLLLASLLVAMSIEWVDLSHVRQFSIVSALQILPYFLAGALVREAKIPTTRTVDWLATVTLVAVGIWQALVVSKGMSPIPFLVPLLGLLAIALLCPRLSALALIGRYSMAIFLYHALVLAALAPRLWGSPAVILLCLVVLGIGLPILFERVISHKFPALLPVTLGQRRVHRPANPETVPPLRGGMVNPMPDEVARRETAPERL